MRRSTRGGDRENVKRSDGGLVVGGGALWEVAKRLECLKNVCDVVGALLGFAFHALEDQFGKRGGEREVVASRIGGWVGEPSGDDGEDVIALPSLLSCDHLKEDRSEGVDISAGVDLGVGGDLFGGHISGGADDATDDGLKVTRSRGVSSDAKVCNDGASVVFDEDVFGFEVAVDDFDAVGGIESFADLDGEVVGFEEREGSAMFKDTIKGLAVDQFHREIIASVFFAKIEDPSDVAVCNFSGESNFALKTSEDLGILDLPGEQEFEGDDIVEFEVACAVDFARSAFTDQGDQFVAACNALRFERCASARIEFGGSV